MTTTMAPFRELLKTFTWSPELQSAFDESKVEINKRIHEGVQIFEKDRPTCLATD